MALKTLFYGLDECRARDMGRTLYINARYYDGAHEALPREAVCVQWFKPYADALSARGYVSVPTIEDIPAGDVGAYDTVLILIPKNMVEARYCVARALQFLKPEGALYCSAENKAGGTRLQKIVQQFGVEIVQQISKHKSRFIQAYNIGADVAAVDIAVADGSMQAVDKTGFTAQAGIYGWEKIDKGSAVLLQHLPKDIKGKIADFGCGYGYLLQHILQHNAGVKLVYAIDADARALAAARVNAGAAANESGRVQYLWEDLTTPKNIPTRLDAIIMNPPFHEGKRTDSEIGIAFIKTAAASLKRGGALYMVANNQLPYEPVLNEVFFTVEVLAQKGGFKVFRAVV